MSKLKDPTSRGPESPCCVVTVVGVQLVTGRGRAAALLEEDTDTQLNFYYIVTKIHDIWTSMTLFNSCNNNLQAVTCPDPAVVHGLS